MFKFIKSWKQYSNKDIIKENVSFEDYENYEDIWDIDQDYFNEVLKGNSNKGFINEINRGFVCKYEIISKGAKINEDVYPGYEIIFNIKDFDKVEKSDYLEIVELGELLNIDFDIRFIVYTSYGTVDTIYDFKKLTNYIFRFSNNNYMSENVVLTDFSIALTYKEPVRFKATELAKLYDWKPDWVIDDNIYASIEKSELVDTYITSDNAALLGDDPYEYTSSYHLGIDYEPDINFLLNYDLSQDNIELLIKAFIKEIGWDEIYNNSSDELEQENIKTPEELLSFFKKSTYKKEWIYLIENILILHDSEILNEVKQIVGDHKRSAAETQVIKDAEDELENMLNKDFDDFKIKENKIKVPYKVGEEEKYYDSTSQTYYFKFDNRWLEVLDDYWNLSLQELLNEYLANERQDLKPYYKDYYGSEDQESIDSDVKHLLKNFLEK